MSIVSRVELHFLLVAIMSPTKIAQHTNELGSLGIVRIFGESTLHGLVDTTSNIALLKTIALLPL